MKMQDKGFTLVELLLVLGITMLIVGLSVVSLLGFKSRNAADGEARKVEAALKQAQQNSISQLENVEWMVNIGYPNSTSFTISHSVPGAELRRVNLENGMQFLGSGKIVFKKISGDVDLGVTTYAPPTLPIEIVIKDLSTNTTASVKINASSLISR